MRKKGAAQAAPEILGVYQIHEELWGVKYIDQKYQYERVLVVKAKDELDAYVQISTRWRITGNK